MRVALGIVFLIMIALMCVCIYQTRKMEGRLAQKVNSFLIMSLITLTVNAVSFISTNYYVLLVAVSAYLVCIDWTLLYLTYYVEEYTQTFRLNRFVKGILYAGILADILILAVNVFWNNVFEVEPVTVRGEIFYTAAIYQGKSLFHFIVAYVMLLLCIVMLAAKAIKTQRFYRTQYLAILSLFVLAVMASITSQALGTLIDLSIFFYFTMAFAVNFFSLYLIPRELLNRTVTYAINDMNEFVFCFDLWGKCIYVNNCVLTDFPNVDIRALAEQEFATWREQNQKEPRDNFQWMEKRMVDGKVRHMENVYHKLKDARSECIGYFFVVKDRTEEIANYQKEHYRMTHDELTGLYKREYFYEQVERVLTNNPDKKYYLMCTNISGFKVYNELFGEESGDEVLITQANLLRKTNGVSEVYGRLSGDEFALVVPEEKFSEEELVRHTMTMREEFSNSLYSMHICAGVYAITDREESVEQMCNKAKIAIDSIKGDHDKVFAYFNDQLLEKTLNEQRLVGELEKALAEEQFCIYLQPLVKADGTLVGAEALVRWRHPEWGLILPRDFVPVSEHTGLLWKVDKYVWEEAVRRLKIWQSIQRNDWFISVNISLSDFVHIDVYETFVDLVEKYNIEPRNLKLELGESVLMRKNKEQLETLQKLRSYGFEIVIDNFGDGNSSLNMLKDDNVDMLKMDIRFLHGDDKADRSWSIIRFVIELAKELGMKVVTEGVETKEQVDRLMAMGCNVYQGYFFAKPMPVDEFEYKYM